MQVQSSALPKSFRWLNVTQFLGALNDNVFKLLVVFMLVDRLGNDLRTAIGIASAMFVLPFLLFAHAGGVLADRFSKRAIIVSAKIAEAAIMALAIPAIAFGHGPSLYGLIFLMSSQSALFGPSKYGIIPELVSTSQLSRANSAIVGLTYVAIIVGSFLPSLVLVHLFPGNFLALGIICLAVALAGALSSFCIGHSEYRGSDERQFSAWFIRDFARTLRSMRSDGYLLAAVLGSAYFSLVGAFLQQNLLYFGQQALHLGVQRSGFLFPLAALGIGMGALLAGRLSGRHIEFGIVPLGAAGLAFACAALGLFTSLPTTAALIVAIGISSGLFIVPLDAFVQFRSPRERLGEILACSSFLSWVGVAGAVGAFVLLTKVLEFSAAQCFLVVALLTAILAIVTFRMLPDFFVRFVGMIVTRCIYRIRTAGLEHVPVSGGALLVSNHVTYVDAMLIAAVHPRRVRFVMARDTYERHWLAPVFRLMRVIPISPRDPPRRIVASLQEARKALDDGYLVCIFPEGALTRNGNLLPFRGGWERIVKGSSHPVIPLYIGGAWGSIFSYYHGRPFLGRPRRIPYPVQLAFGEPLAADVSTDELQLRIRELSGTCFRLRRSRSRTLSRLFVASARRWWSRPAFSDTSGKRLTFGRALCAATMLAQRVEELAPGQLYIGIALPPSVGAALANLAVLLTGRVPVNLNYTLSEKAIRSAVAQCNMRTVISSRIFVKKFPAFHPPEGTVWIEDLAAGLSPWAKFRAFCRARFSPARRLHTFRQPQPDDVATVIFSSGSTGEPKGILLSHHNIVSNIEGFQQVFHFSKKDRMCGVLPLFHSFGFTTTLCCPLLNGFPVVFHTSPLDSGKIVEMIRKERITVVLSTPTFLQSYMRRATREDFVTVRILVTGAEKLRPAFADTFEAKIGIRPLEGYGTTELSPAVAIALPDVTRQGITQAGSRPGSVGQPIPGVAVAAVDPTRGTPLPAGREGLLRVKGPNVMLGYLGAPDKTAEVLFDGWYDTGDIGKVDSEGFVYVIDRYARYSKIGGEMVPHLAVEETLYASLGAADRAVAVTAAVDEKKGEQLVVFYTDEAGDVQELQHCLQHSDLPNLWRPRKENYVRVDALPYLGTGKLDLHRLRSLAAEFVAERPGTLGRVMGKLRDKL